jgi:hypothetical protein
VVTENEVLAMKAHTNDQATVVEAFASVSSNPKQQQTNSESGKSSHNTENDSSRVLPRVPPTLAQRIKTTPLWLGNLSRRNIDSLYLQERDKLSDSAKWGNWSRMFSALEAGERRFGENWVNAVRLCMIPIVLRVCISGKMVADMGKQILPKQTISGPYGHHYIKQHS